MPRHADPTFVGGARLGHGIDVQIGYGTTTVTQTSFGREDVAAFAHRQETRGLVAAVGVADRIGGLTVRGSVSVGLDRFLSSTATYRPDSADVYNQEAHSSSRELVLMYDGHAESDGRIGHVGASAAVGVERGRGWFRFAPSVGVAGLVSTKVSSEATEPVLALSAPAPRVAVFVRLPVTVRVRGVAITAEATVAGGGTLGEDGSVLARRRARSDGGVLGSALRIDF